MRSPFSSRSYILRLFGSHFPFSSIARMVSRIWAWGPVPFVVDGKVGYHAFGNKKLPAVVTDKVGVLFRRDFPWDGKHEPPGKLGVPLFFLRFGRIP